MVGKWSFTYMDVSENSGTPKSSILIGCSVIDHPFWGTPILETPIWSIWSFDYFWGQNSTSISATILPLALNPCLVWKSRPAVRRSPSQSCGTRPSARPGERTLPGDMATWELWNVSKSIRLIPLYIDCWLVLTDMIRCISINLHDWHQISNKPMYREGLIKATTWLIERPMALRAV